MMVKWIYLLNKARRDTMAEIGLNDLMTAITELASDMKEVKSVTSRLETDVKELKETTSRLETDVKELKETTSRLETDVKELKETTSRLETDVGELRKEMNHGFRRLDKKFGILSDELIEVKTDITFLEENRN